MAGTAGAGDPSRPSLETLHADTWLSMDDLTGGGYRGGEGTGDQPVHTLTSPRSIHGHSRRKSPTLDDLIAGAYEHGSPTGRGKPLAPQDDPVRPPGAFSKPSQLPEATLPSSDAGHAQAHDVKSNGAPSLPRGTAHSHKVHKLSHYMPHRRVAAGGKGGGRPRRRRAAQGRGPRGSACRSPKTFAER